MLMPESCSSNVGLSCTLCVCVRGMNFFDDAVWIDHQILRHLPSSWKILIFDGTINLQMEYFHPALDEKKVYFKFAGLNLSSSSHLKSLFENKRYPPFSHTPMIPC